MGATRQAGRHFPWLDVLQRKPAAAPQLSAEVADLRRQLAERDAELRAKDAKLAEARRLMTDVAAELRAERARPAPDAVLRAQVETERTRANVAEAESARLGTKLRQQTYDLDKVREVARLHGAQPHELPDAGLAAWRVNARLDAQEAQRKADAAEAEATAKIRQEQEDLRLWALHQGEQRKS